MRNMSCGQNYAFGEGAMTKLGVHLNKDLGVSVLGGPLSVMKVWQAAPKLKTTP